MSDATIRSIDLTIGQNRIRFTVLTDVLDNNDYRRQQLNHVVNTEYNRDEFINLATECYELMQDKTFLFWNMRVNRTPIDIVIDRFRGDITLTKEWMAVHSHDIYMNCTFNNIL